MPSPARSEHASPTAAGQIAPAALLWRHWRGELPLPRSLWLHFVLPGALLSLALGGLGTWMAVQGEPLRAGSAALLAGWPLMWLLAVWGAVGAWRAAGAGGLTGGAVAWRLGTRALLVLWMVALAASTAFSFAPHLAHYVALAMGRDPMGQLQASLTPDGRRLRLDGAIGLGDASRVQQLLQAAPQARLLELRSPGGRVAEARQIADAVRRRGGQTRAVGLCANACVLVFLAGSGRQLMPDSQLALHRVPAPTLNPLLRSLALSEQGAQWRQAGLPAAFILNTLSSPPASPWLPGQDELVAAELVGNPARPLDVPLPAPEGAQAGDYADALASNLVWRALDKRYPGTIATAAAQMSQARAVRADDEATQVAGQAIVQALVPELLLNTGPERRELYLALTADQLGAAGSPQACRGLLAGDTAVVHAMPAPLAQREAAWLMDVAGEPLRDGAPRRANALELEVVRRSLGDRAPTLLAGLSRPVQATGRGPACEVATALIAEVLRLPPAERKLATRLIYER